MTNHANTSARDGYKLTTLQLKNIVEKCTTDREKNNKIYNIRKSRKEKATMSA